MSGHATVPLLVVPLAASVATTSSNSISCIDAIIIIVIRGIVRTVGLFDIDEALALRDANDTPAPRRAFGFVQGPRMDRLGHSSWARRKTSRASASRTSSTIASTCPQGKVTVDARRQRFTVDGVNRWVEANGLLGPGTDRTSDLDCNRAGYLDHAHARILSPTPGRVSGSRTRSP